MLLSPFDLFARAIVSTTMDNSMGQIVPMTSLALSQSMDSVNTATNEEEVCASNHFNSFEPEFNQKRHIATSARSNESLRGKNHVLNHQIVSSNGNEAMAMRTIKKKTNNTQLF